MVNLAPGGPGKVLEIIGRIGLQLLNTWLACSGILSSKSVNYGEDAGKT